MTIVLVGWDETTLASHPLPYTTDKWIIGSSVLLLFGIIPGIIALGVDLGTGAWRSYETPAVIMVPAPPKTNRRRLEAYR